MAEQPNIFEVTDPNTKKMYRVEAPFGMSQEDALQQFESLEPDDRVAFEFNPQTTATQTPPKQQAQVPAQAPAQIPTPADTPRELTPLEKGTGLVETPTFAFENSPEIAARAEQLFRSGVRTPGKFNTLLAQEFPDVGTFNVSAADLTGAKERQKFLDDNGITNQGIFISTLPTGVKDPEAPTGAAIVTEGIKRGLAGFTSDTAAFGGLIADVVGADETSDNLLDLAAENDAKIALNLPRAVPTVQDIDSIGDVGAFILESGSELLPQITSSVGSGFIGSAAARSLVRKKAQDFIEDRVARGVAREIAEKEAAEFVVEKAAQKGAIAGTALQTVTQESGSTFSQTFQETGEKAPIMSLVAGVASGSLDAILPLRALNRLGVPSDLVKKSLARRMLQEGAKDFAIEGATEAAQTFIQSLPIAVINGESPFTQEMLGQMVDAAARGGAGGFSVGAATGAVQGIRGSRVLPPEAETTIVAPTGRRNSKKFKQGLALAQNQVVDKVNAVTEGWTNAPQILVHQNFKAVRGLDDDALGAYTDDGQVVLNTEAILDYAERKGITPDEAVTATVFHEALGHNGLTQQFGDELDTMLNTIYDRGNDEFRQRVDDWLDAHPDAYRISPTNAKAEDPAYRLTRAVEEVLAEEVEGKGILPLGVVDRVLDLIKRFARQAGLDVKYSSREIRGILGVSQRTVTSGSSTGETPGSVKNMVVYHGGPRDLERFDSRFIGTGEGNRIFGHGFYFTDLKKIATHYKNTLSDVTVSWGGVPGRWFDVRANAQAEAQRRFSVEDQILVDNVLTFAASNSDLNLRDFANWYSPNSKGGDHNVVLDPDGPSIDEIMAAVEPAFNFVKQNLKQEFSGKVFEVELSDDSKWLDWESPVKGQPELVSALGEQGISVVPDEDFRRDQRLFAAVSLKHKSLSNTATNFDIDPAISDEAFNNLQTLNPSFLALKEKVESTVSELSDGQEAYAILSSKLGDSKETSLYLSEKGFAGNRYLADNIRQEGTRKNDGTDTFNYVVFDDAAPIIRAKFSKKAEGSGPLRVEDLTADDLVESENALGILKNITRNHTPTTISFDDIEGEALARNVKPSTVTRLVGKNAGDLVRRLFMYDIAAEKLNTRLLNIQEKITKNGLTEADQTNYLKTLGTLEDLTAQIFDEQSEIGRALGSLRRMNFTRKRVETLKQALSEVGFEALEDPATFFKLMETVAEGQAAAKKKSTKGENIISALNVPRAVMSSMDLSAPMRQGIVFIGTKEYWSSFFKMFSFLGPSGEANFQQVMTDISRRPTSDLMAQAGLSFSLLDGSLSRREEDFQSNLAEKIPGVRISNRAYSGFLNKLRADMFDKYVEQLSKAGIEPDNDLLAGLGRFINSATGRAELPGPLQSMAPQLNAAFFSPRLIQSRVNMLNPNFYQKLPAPVRKEAIKSMIAMGTILSLTVGAVAAMFPDEVEVELDLRSSDFGKIKADNTRFDLGGGFLQYLTFGARTAAWLAGQPAVKTSSGDVRELGADGLTQQRYGKLAVTFFRNKLSPNASFVVDYTLEENAKGEPFELGTALSSRLIPMHFQSVMDAAQEYDPVTAVAVTSPGIFGIGVNTYIPKSLDKDQDLEAPESFEMKEQDEDGEFILEDGESALAIAQDGVVHLKGDAIEMWDATLNNYFQIFIKEDIVATGKDWEELTPKEQKELISGAKADARAEAKADMLIELGLE